MLTALMARGYAISNPLLEPATVLAADKPHKCLKPTKPCESEDKQIRTRVRLGGQTQLPGCIRICQLWPQIHIPKVA
jgi:hypothetical protein